MKKILVFTIVLVFFKCGGLEKKWVSKVEFLRSGCYYIYSASGTHLAGSLKKDEDSTCGFLASYSDKGSFMWSSFFKNPDIRSSQAKQIIEIYNRIYILIEAVDNTGKNAVFVAGYDGFSNMLWNRKIIESAPGKKISGSLFCDSRGDIYIGGSLLNKKDSLASFMTKLNLDGEIAWAVQYYNPQMDIDDPKFGVSTGDQSVITGLSKNRKNFLYLRYNQLGILVAMKVHENANGEWSTVVGAAVDRNRVIYILAAAKNDSTATDFLTAAYGENDSLLWTQVYSSPGKIDDIPEKLILDDSMDVYVFGTARDPEGMRIVSIKYDNEGSEVWRRVYQDKEKDIAEPFLINPAYHIVCSAGNDILMLEYNEHGFLKMNMRFRHGSGKNVPIGFSNNCLVLEDQAGNTSEYYIVKFEPSQLGFFRWD